MNYDGYYDRLVSLYSEYREFDCSKIPLCAAENYVSPFVKQGLISKYEGKYISGYINRDREKDFIGSDYLEKILFLANDMAADLFGAKYNDFRSLTGMNTVALILMTLIDKDTKILITDPQSGGHGSLPKLCTNLGVRYESIPYDYSIMQVDYDKLNYILAHDHTISFLFFCQSDVIQPPELQSIKLPPHVGIIYDATQTLGLIAGEVLTNPLSVCDNIIMIGGTHKTFPSVTCGYVATNNDGYIQKVSQNISPNFLRNVQINNITSVCLTMLEMLKFGTDYARKIVHVANDLGSALNEYGISVKHTADGAFSHTHQLFIEHPLDKVDFTYSQFRNYGITLNKRKTNYLTGFRVGVQEIARYGFDKHISELARLLYLILRSPAEKTEIMTLKAQLAQLKTDQYVIDTLFMELE